MIGFWNPLFAFILKGLKAWGSSLLSVLPERFVPFFQYRTSPYEVYLDDINEFLQHFPVAARGQEISFNLGRKMLLKHIFFVPNSAKANLQNVIHLEAVRIMPVSLDQLVLSFKQKPVENEQIKVTLFATRKEYISRLKHAAKQKILFPAAFYNSSEDIHFKDEEITKRQTYRAGLLGIFVVTFFFIVRFIPDVYGNRIGDELGQMDIEIVEARQRTSQIAVLQKEMDQLAKLADSVDTLTMDNSILKIFEELTNFSPDDVVVSSFRLQGRVVYLSGYSDNPEEWVIELNKSSVFQDAILSAVRINEKNNSKKFDLRMSIVPLKAGEQR